MVKSVYTGSGEQTGGGGGARRRGRATRWRRLGSGRGPIRDDFIYRLVLDFKTIITFYSLVQIQRNQCPLLHYDPLYPVKQLKHIFESLKFEFQIVCI